MTATLLVLCHACRRHARATETACPFCGSALAGAPPSVPSTPSPCGGHTTRSRAQRYVLGAAVAASIGIAKASGASTDAGASAPIVAPLSPEAGVDEREQAARERNHPSYQEQHQGSPCTRACCFGPTVCPPYGCVFPVDACDVVRA